MSQILELMAFFAMCLTNVFQAMDNTMLGDISLLSIVCGMGYVSITFWGVFSLLNAGDNSNHDI